MKISVFLSWNNTCGILIQNAAEAFKRYKTYNGHDSAYRYYYFVLNNIVYLKIL